MSMTNTEINLNPVDFITVGTIGPKGRRVFHLQAGHEGKLISFTIEKEQARALSQAINEFIEELDKRLDVQTQVQMTALDMELREPIEPLFRFPRLALAYDEAESMVIVIAQENVALTDSEADDEDEDDDEDSGRIVRMWCSREQIYALSIQAQEMVEAGRPEPQQNGRILYYWT
jgi:uncharacterized repeat protein (TIGR03847 family)